MVKYKASVLIGPSGVDKYRVGRMVAERGKSESKQIFDINSGWILRDVTRSLQLRGYINSDIGETVRTCLQTGRRPPTDIVMKVLRESINYFVFSGYFNPDEQYLIVSGIPRSIDQVAPFNEIVDVDAIFFLNASKKTLEERVRRRWRRKRRPEDKSDKAFETRYKLVWNETYPILEKYPGRVVELSSNDRGYLADRILQHLSQ